MTGTTLLSYNSELQISCNLDIVSTLFGRNKANVKKTKGNAKRGVSPRLKIWPGDLDL